jgi:AcrR family transcriptional regulator
MRKREATKSRNRALLLEAGRRVFAKKGYDAARITDITGEANLAAGTFYKYFDDKFDLFNVIIDELTPLFRQRLREARRVGDDTSPAELAARGFAAFLDIVEEYPELIRLFLIEGSSRERRFDERIYSIRGEYESDLVRDLETLAAAVAIPRVQIDLLSRAVISMTAAMAVRFLENPRTLREPILHVLTNLLIGGTRALMRESGVAVPSRPGVQVNVPREAGVAPRPTLPRRAE